MATFVLVHGAWHGGWCYRRVARQLRAAGHDVYTPTLTGLGESSHLLTGSVNLDTHIQDILNVIQWEDLNDVVLCGHSYGGMVVTGAADAIPDRIVALVYLDAFVPEDGNCLMDFFGDERRNTILEDAAALGGHAIRPPPVESFGVNENDRQWVRAKMTPHPLATTQQPIRLTGGYGPSRRRVYVYAEGRATSARFYKKFRADPAWVVHVTDGGHDQMIDAPEHVTAILIEAAG